MKSKLQEKKGVKVRIFTGLYNFFLRHEKNKITTEIYRFLCKRNPLVLATINGQTIYLPFSHMLPFYQNKYQNYDRELGKICKTIKEKSGHLRVIDIGANVGDTIVNIGIKNAEYLAIEGEKEYFDILIKNVIKEGYRVKFEEIFLSDLENDDLYTPTKKHGTAHLTKTSDKKGLKTWTLSNLMDRKYKDFHADIVKIDTDGFDFKVIRGGKKYLETEKSLLFFEWTKKELNMAGENELSIFPVLQAMGYEHIVLYDNFGKLVTVLKTENLEQLAHLITRTVKPHTRVYYYDILAIHKNSAYKYSDFVKNRNFA